MKIRKGDTVKIITGKDANKTGKITQVLPADQQVVVEGLNKRVKHMRPQKQGQKGQRLEFNAPVHISNVQVVCSKCNKITRVGFKVLADGRKERQCNKCKETL
ncbi:MAG: 50S ribosomal protein L24 [Patescibacteria group bacterium]|jgi:large subunit ribosomal protein L24